MSYDGERIAIDLGQGRTIPSYLKETYWWAYIHPNAVYLFERQWLVNLILFGNFARLRDAALDELGAEVSGKTLQVACVYGNFTELLARRIVPGGSLDVVDILPIQLSNLSKKLPAQAPVALHQRNSADLGFADAVYDQTVVFFLLHEMPVEVRIKTLSEALRVTRPGGKVVIIDYHLPRRLHPLRYLFRHILDWLEPFALDLWRHEVIEWLPESVAPEHITKTTYFGGLYQKLVITAPLGG